MSHRATNWALEVRGVKPTTRMVLIYLSDCHNSQTGECFPRQDTLAEMCEVSRSTVNLHLAELEKQGLIKRVQRVNKRTKKKKSTFYILGCDGDLAQDVEKAVSEYRTRDSGKAVSEKTPKPCPKNRQSRVRAVGHKPVINREKNSAGAREATELDGIAELWAKAIKAGKGVVASAIKTSVAQRMLELGLVSEADLKKHRISW